MIVIEFFGLPGSGKSTIAQHLSSTLKARGYAVKTSEDFIAWLSGQSIRDKFRLLLGQLWRFSYQLYWCALFGVQQRPFGAVPCSRIVRIPYLSLCLERYLNTLDDEIVILDQANVQLIWSASAFSHRYDRALLQRAINTTTASSSRRRFVCLTTDVAETSKRLRARASSHSRFDALSKTKLDQVLPNASTIIIDIRNCIEQAGLPLTEIDGARPPQENAEKLALQISEDLPSANLTVGGSSNQPTLYT